MIAAGEDIVFPVKVFLLSRWHTDLIPRHFGLIFQRFDVFPIQKDPGVGQVPLNTAWGLTWSCDVIE